MPTSPRPFAPSWHWALMFVPAAALTWGVHEASHWLMGRLLGYEMWISLNAAGPVSGEYESIRDQILIAGAGPLVTYLQAGMAYAGTRATRVGWLFPFLYLATWMRTLAFAISFSNPNDEARIGLLLGLPLWVVPSVVTGLLLAATIRCSRSLGIGARGHLIAFVMSSLVTTAIVLLDA